ncbi:MAG: hypothetical protein M3410_12855 [Acidobacteriota bacterium]|nr:hypothetical protein [Acidobacteriota bacterium]
MRRSRSLSVALGALLAIGISSNRVSSAQSVTKDHGHIKTVGHEAKKKKKEVAQDSKTAAATHEQEAAAHADETAGEEHAAKDDGGHSGDVSFKVESEFVGGQHGYRYGIFNFTTLMSGHRSLRLGARFVREFEHSPTFPALTAKFSMQAAKGLEVEPFAFSYLPRANQYSVGAGVRFEKKLFDFRLGGRPATLSVIGSPVFANVKALRPPVEDSHSDLGDTPAVKITSSGTVAAAAAATPAVVEPLEPTFAIVNQFMLVGGIKLDSAPFSVSVFGNQSFFSRDTGHLETPLDVEEMTHFVAHKNNSGFAKNSVGTEGSYSPLRWLKLSGGYSALWFQDLPLRHSAFIRPNFIFGETEIFGGFQTLRGGHVGNNLGFVGIGFRF